MMTREEFARQARSRQAEAVREQVAEIKKDIQKQHQETNHAPTRH